MRKIEIDCSSERTPGADHLVADLRGVLPGEDGVQPGGAALGEHLGDRWGEDVVGLVDQQRDSPPLRLGLVVLGLERAVQQLQQQLGDEDGVVFTDGGLGAGDDQDLAALEDPLELDRYGVAQQRVDLARGVSRSSLLRGGLSAWAA